jgi:hypothetical protein
VSQPADRRGMDRQVRFARILGLIFSAVGFTVIVLGWNGMAKVACPDCQLPYLLSGGAAGLGLILVGGVLLLMAQIRSERMKLGEQVDQAAGLLSRAMSSASAASSANGQVVAGKSTYHRRECRLVEGKADLNLVTVEVARLQGLSPCRVCNPGEEDVPKAAPKAAPRRRAPRKAKS